ncbi:MAG TPA: universal stress protein [Chloroflexota bacterium]
MRRVLVPLDGSALAESIIPDARRLAGPGGELILVRDASRPSYDMQHGVAAGSLTISEAEAYLTVVARLLREQGVRIQARTTFMHDIPLAIDEAAKLFDADMIACATHGRTVVGRLVRGGAAWRAVAGSNVPVLLRNAEDSEGLPAGRLQYRRIMVPLDGSQYAERALPLAQQLALEWNAQIVLVRVVSGLPEQGLAFGPVAAYAIEYQDELAAAQEYLERIARGLTAEVQTRSCIGGIVDGLLDAVEGEGITDIVMTSHGRTGLSRVILGSIADLLIHRLHLPIIVIPALAARSVDVEDRSTDAIPMPAGRD